MGMPQPRPRTGAEYTTSNQNTNIQTHNEMGGKDLEYWSAIL